jgi:cation diffusion facilitator family transporter
MKEKIAILAVAANVSLAAGKISVGIISGSVAVLAAGIDSLVDIFSSIISLVGIKISSRPADKEHPYGHYKFEALSGALITIFILVTGIGIIYDAIRSFFSPALINIGFLTFSVMTFSVVINEIMARLKIHYGKKENSVSLLSDGVHSRLDVYTSLAVLAGLLLTRYWVYADAVLAILMGLYIIKEAFFVGKEAFGSLLDVSAGEEIENNIKKIVREEQVKMSNLKTQKRGSVVTANLEISLSKDLKLEEANKIITKLRDQLISKIEKLQYVVIETVSHETESGYYKPEFGRSINWLRRKGVVKMPRRDGTGPEGQGPRTGRGKGACIPKDDNKENNQSNRPAGQGRGIGRGKGRGLGVGSRDGRLNKDDE